MTDTGHDVNGCLAEPSLVATSGNSHRPRKPGDGRSSRRGLERQRRSRGIKIGNRVVRHGRHVAFQLAEIAIPRRLFAGDPATGRRPAAEGGADVTRRVIAAVGLNRRAPASRHLPNDGFLAPKCVSERSRTHRAPSPKTPNRIPGSRFRAKHKYATVFGGWGESSGKIQLIEGQT